MVSIIIPFYNAATYLNDCLNSVKRQSYRDIEVICVNDGSTDNGGALCQDFVNNDIRFKLINQENGGVSKARNVALETITGEYVCFMDADDILHENHIENLLDLISSADLAVTNYTRRKEDLGTPKTRTQRYSAKEFIYKTEGETIKHPQLWSMLYKTSVIRENGLRFTEGCIRNEDTEFYIKYLANVLFVNANNRITYYYRDTEGSAIHTFIEKSLTFIEADRRISDYLVERDIYPPINYLMANSIQYFVFKCSRQKNAFIYEMVHERYDVKDAMKKMLKFPRKSRVAVSLIYLLLGKNLFYKTMSLI